MSLSDHIIEPPPGLTCACGKCDLRNLKVPKVKEFIRRLKENLMFRLTQKQDLRSVLCQVIDELAGPKLVGSDNQGCKKSEGKE